MEEEKYGITDNSNDRKYFSLLPHYILNHSTAIDQALYMQMKKHAGESPSGECYLSKRTLLKKLGIGQKALNKSLAYLLDKKWIYVKGKREVMTEGGPQQVTVFGVSDIWKLNVDFYETKGASKSTHLDTKVLPKGGGGASRSTPNKNLLNKKNTITANAEEFSFKEELEKLRTSTRKDHNAVALYWFSKGFIFENKEQFRSNLLRDLKAFSIYLKGYNGKQIELSINYCKKEYPEIWTFETVGKRITQLVNKK